MGRPGRPAIEREGQRFGLVVALKRVASGKDGGARWLVRCDCGVERVVAARTLDETPQRTHVACRRAQRVLAAEPAP
jgi:hypothetical protein